MRSMPIKIPSLLFSNFLIFLKNCFTKYSPKFPIVEPGKKIILGSDLIFSGNFRFLVKSAQIGNTFIEGKHNQFAKAACNSVADTPGNTPFNPLLIYSETGLGKTHLLQAIGNKILKRYPNYNLTFLTSERFMLEFISAIQKNKTTDFANQ